MRRPRTIQEQHCLSFSFHKQITTKLNKRSFGSYVILGQLHPRLDVADIYDSIRF